MKALSCWKEQIDGKYFSTSFIYVFLTLKLVSGASVYLQEPRPCLSVFWVVFFPDKAVLPDEVKHYFHAAFSYTRKSKHLGRWSESLPPEATSSVGDLQREHFCSANRSRTLSALGDKTAEPAGRAAFETTVYTCHLPFCKWTKNTGWMGCVKSIISVNGLLRTCAFRTRAVQCPPPPTPGRHKERS